MIIIVTICQILIASLYCSRHLNLVFKSGSEHSSAYTNTVMSENILLVQTYTSLKFLLFISGSRGKPGRTWSAGNSRPNGNPYTLSRGPIRGLNVNPYTLSRGSLRGLNVICEVNTHNYNIHI